MFPLSEGPITKCLLYFISTCTVGIQLSALQLPETSSYRTFFSSLTEWSRDKADHSVNKLFGRYFGHYSVTGQKVCKLNGLIIHRCLTTIQLPDFLFVIQVTIQLTE